MPSRFARGHFQYGRAHDERCAVIVFRSEITRSRASNKPDPRVIINLPNRHANAPSSSLNSHSFYYSFRVITRTVQRRRTVHFGDGSEQ